MQCREKMDADASAELLAHQGMYQEAAKASPLDTQRIATHGRPRCAERHFDIRARDWICSATRQGKFQPVTVKIVICRKINLREN